MDYPGKVIRKTPVTPTQASASGVWTLDDAIAATKTNTWPVAGVPNPISKSLRFNSADSAYLNRTPSATGDRKKFTYSCWAKRSAIGTSGDQILFRAADGVANFNFVFSSNDTLFSESGATNLFTSTPVYRDPSAWYHIVMVFDSDNATAANRFIVYVNNVSQAKASGSVSSGTQLAVNTQNPHYIGASPSDRFLSGYMTEIYFVDGQALTPSSFGMTDPQTGAWEPIKYTGTYGTNGFYLNFSDNSSTSALGNDYSGNGNNWTTNNFSVTAGAGNDSLTDVPTPWIAYNTTGDVGGVVRGNYATLNPLAVSTSGITYTNGNLDVSMSVNNLNVFGSIQIPTTGKWYWEHQITTIGGGSAPMGGVAAGFITDLSNAVVYRTNGDKILNGTQSAYGATYTTTDIIGVAVNVDSGTVTFYKNGSSQGAITFSAGGLFPLLRANAAPDAFVINFGQRPFAYTPPAGFLSLCTTNLPNPTIGTLTTTQANKYMDVSLYTGNGSSQSVTNSGSFQPDFVWVKGRSGTTSHNLSDAVRGTASTLFSNTTGAENGSSARINAFNSNGFSVGNDTDVNTNTATYVGWQWNAGGSNATNTSGTITSTVRANTTAGFSIVTYTGTGANATVGHGLGVAPSMIIVKQRDAITDWYVYHSALAATDFVRLNLSNAKGTNTGLWNSTAPTSTVFSLGGYTEVDANTKTYVAYCFAPVAGYSAFGSYTGNGSTDGPFVYTGFRPRFVLLKPSTAVQDWMIVDTSRSPYNVTNTVLAPNSSLAESSFASGYDLDILSNGFKMRNSVYNANGATIIYAAFAEFPFKFSLAR